MEPYKYAGTVIVFNQKFNGDLTKHLINAFKENDSEDFCELILSDYFNKQFKIIPRLIVSITFGGCFNKSVNIFHSLLEDLIFRSAFNKPTNYLPSSIIKLIFGQNFNQSINNLPNSTTNLSLNNKFNKKINKFPGALQSLLFISNNKLTIKYSRKKF